MKPQPQFLRIRWDETTEQGGAITLETMACHGTAGKSHSHARTPEALAVDGGRTATSALAGIPGLFRLNSPIRVAISSGPLTAAWHARPLSAPRAEQ